MPIYVYILLAFLGVVVLFLLFVATRPGKIRIERRATMSASPEAIFPHLNDFHRWPGWSPWEKLDPDMKREHEGPESGVGAKYHWVGNKKVGEGRMTILESEPSRRLLILLEFLKPFAATNHTEFTLIPEGNRTTLSWAMTGKANFMMKMFGIFFNMDKLIGADFEKGLAGIDALVSPRPA